LHQNYPYHKYTSLKKFRSIQKYLNLNAEKRDAAHPEISVKINLTLIVFELIKETDSNDVVWQNLFHGITAT